MSSVCYQPALGDVSLTSISLCLQLLLAPSAAPQNLVAHLNATSHDSIFLSWDPLPLTERNGVILGYVVNLTDISNGSNIQLYSESHNLTVHFLRPYTTYTCIVAAYTSIGTGLFSAEISVQTQETSKNVISSNCCLTLLSNCCI